MDIEEYRYLWDGSSTGWSLLHLNADNASEKPRYSIINVETMHVLLIEDNAKYLRVKHEMIEHGAKLINPQSLIQ